MEKITPPASPKLAKSHSLPTQPAFDTGYILIPSDDSTSLLSDNFYDIEEIMLAKHQDIWSADTSPIREMLDDVFATPPQNTALEQPRQTSENLKVEVPLMLNDAPHQIGPSGSDAFKDFLDAEKGLDLDPEFERADLHDISDDELDSQLQTAAGKVMRTIEQEKLQATDAVGRVTVPVMDFVVPQPEWTRLGCSESGILKWIQSGKEQLFTPPTWPIDRAKASMMIWSPLAPGSGKMTKEENMDEGVPLVNRYLDTHPNEVIATSLDYVHHKEKPEAFEDEDQDEEIEPQLTRKKPVIELMDTVKKRLADTNAGGSPKRPRHTLMHTSLIRRIGNDTPDLLPRDSPGVSGSLLANFMEVHAPRKKVMTHSKYFAAQQPDAPLSPSQPELPIEPTSHRTLQQAKIAVKAICPAIKPPATALTIFISIRMHRRTIRVLEGLIPDLTLIERNFEAYNTFTWNSGSVVRTEVTPPLADDADITVSPSTGLIVTSMIRVRQKPRAGTNKGMIQIRVEKASQRYERLVVLVGGEGGKDDNLDAMSTSDSNALLELQGFASGLECSVQVHYVGGGDETLAHWVASCICRYSLADPCVLAGLLEPETLWEVFLRRAGFNVFAAQAVASQFKPPGGERTVAPSAQHGLSAFMTMTRDERMRRFGQLVGAKILERVSVAVDELWNKG